MGRNAFLPLSLVPLASLGWVVANWGTEQYLHITWASALSMDFDLRFDTLSAIMCVLVLGIGSLILLYCSRYFQDDEPRLGLFAAEMVAFAGAMFGLVVSDNMLLLYTFWELTTVLSFLLVGHYAERASSRRAATQALLVTTAGGLAMLVGIIMLGEIVGSYNLSDVVAAAPHGWLAGVAVVLVLIGALSKSAVVPLHFWLPGAMAAPTPVSGYLHAAAMVKAGIYLVARLAPGFADSAAWRPIVIGLGLASMILAGWRAFRAFDLKLILAFGTVSQLGFLTALVGTGSREAALAGLAMVIAHAMFKACLFMVVGIIDHSTGTRDIRKLAHLAKKAPFLALLAVMAAASMAGLPPFIGFVAKEAALEASLYSDVLPEWARVATTAGIVLGSILTLAYSIRFIWGAFGRKQLKRPSPAVENMHAPGPLLLTAPAILAFGGLAAGFAASWIDELLTPYADTLPTEADKPYHLALWHGISLPLGLTVVVIAGGTALFLAHRTISRLRFEHPPLGNADRMYDATLRGMDTMSLRLTAFIQRGSLPLTQGTILVTLAVLPTVLMFYFGIGSMPATRAWDSMWQAAIGVIMIAAAITAGVLRNRLGGLLAVGVTGYGLGLLFALQGAPDLALTQFLVETVTLVMFVLVMRKLPAEVDTSAATASAGSKPLRALLGTAVGLMVIGIGIYAISARTAEPISLLLPDAAYYGGDGKNIVNVLLVDIRAWDTLGEISVLLVAATGVASLVFRTRRFGSAPRVADAPAAQLDAVSASNETTWLLGGDLIDPRYRSLVLEVTTRLVFPTMMVLSIYFFFSGHNAPGGGFAGGLVAGLALVLRYLAGGRYELGEAVPIDAGKILGLGLTFAAGTALVSMFLGAPALSSATLELSLPLLGDIKLVTALFFDLGVYLIVVGLILDVLRSLGARLDAESVGEAR